MRLAKGRNRASSIISLGSAKCLSIVPRNTEKAGKKFLSSYPLFVATCLPAVKLVCFQTFLISGCQRVQRPFYMSRLLFVTEKRPFFLNGKKLSWKNGKRRRRYAAAIRLGQNRAGVPALFYILREFLGGVLTVSDGFYQFTYFLQNTGQK